jgi:hypothetical protein
MPLVSVDQLGGYLKRTFDDSETFTAQQLLDGAAGAVVEYCGWHIAPVLSETITVDGTGTLIQVLPTLNLLSLDTLTENGRDVNLNLVDWSTNGVLEKRGGGWWTERRRGIVAGITHGYPATPSWVTTLICAVAGRAFNSPLGILTETAGGESVTYTVPRPPVLVTAPPGTVALLPFEKHMLDRIRIPLGA